MKPTIHMLCGLICSGKTTLAKKIAEENNAVVFSNDDWMATIFGQDQSSIGFRYIPNIEKLILITYSRLLKLNIDIILDDGFQTKASRNKIRSYANKLGVNHKLYFLNYPEQVLLQRLNQRNNSKKPAPLIIPESDFHTAKQDFEPPDGSEAMELINENTLIQL